MDPKDVELLRSLCPGLDVGNLESSEHWKSRADNILGKATHNRALYPVLDHTRGEGPWCYDLEGNRYFDLTSGIAVRALGFRPEKQRRFESEIEHVVRHVYSQGFDTVPQVLLAEKLASIAPGNFDKQVFFTTSGARAVENAVKSIIDKTKRRRFVAFRPAFHGRTGYALALTGSTWRHKNDFPQALDVIRVPYPYCYRCPFRLEKDNCGMPCLDYLEDAIQREGTDIAAVIFEPMAGEAGFIVPPKEFAQGLRKVADRYDAFLISDDVQTGMGRTGKWWGIENFDVIPDYICTSKALGAQYPLGATIGPSPLFSTEARQSETRGAEPFQALVSLWIIREIETTGLMENAALVGKYFLEQILELKEEFEILGDARGLGLMIGLEFVRNKKTKEKAPDIMEQVAYNCIYKQRLWVTEAGANCLRLTPHYAITKDEVDMVVSNLLQAMYEVSKTL